MKTKLDIDAEQMIALLASKDVFIDFLNTVPRTGEFTNFEKVKTFILHHIESNRSEQSPPSKSISTRWREYPWDEKLEWCRDFPHPNPSTFERLKIINDFIQNCSDVPFLPVKERSLLLFGKERMLDDMANSVLFGSGRLSFEMLRCYKTHVPLWHETFSPSMGKVIIVENRDTYDSFCRACSEMDVSPYKYVIFGSGTVIYDSIHCIGDLNLETSVIEFFGDIDGSGLELIVRLRNIMVGVDDSISIEMAREFYSRAIELYKDGNKYHVTAYNKKFAWRQKHLDLPPLEYREFVRDLYNKRERVPQEIVNYMEIKKILMEMTI